MLNPDETQLSTRAISTLYVGVALIVGLLTGAGAGLLSATSWDDTSPSPPVAFIIGFLAGTVGALVSVGMNRRRRRKQERGSSTVQGDRPAA